MAKNNRLIRGSDGMTAEAVVVTDKEGNAVGTAAAPQVASEPDGAVPPGSPFSATAAGVLFTIDTLGYDSLSVVFTSAGTGGVVSFYESNDGVTFVNKAGDRGDASSTNANSQWTSATGNCEFIFPCTARYIRATVTTYATGTITAQALLRSSPAPVRSVFLNGGTVNVGNSVGTIAQKSASGGLSQYIFAAFNAASANPLLIKGSAGQVYGYTFANMSTGWRYVHLYNKATAPTMGTDTHVRVIPIPPGGVVMYSSADIGIAFSTGIGVSVTTAPGGTDNTVAAIAANDIVGMIDYA